MRTAVSTMPTASAIVSDLIVAATCGGNHESPAFLNPDVESPAAPLTSNWKSAFYLHIRVKDEPGAFSSFAAVLGSFGISIKQVIQLDHGKNSAPVIVITHPTEEEAMRAAVEVMRRRVVIDDIVNVIRVEKGE